MTTLKTAPVLRSKKYMEWIRSRPCVAVGGNCCGDVVAHHVRLGQNGGVGLKPSDYRCIPLCDEHHKYLHQIGELSFERSRLDENFESYDRYEGLIFKLLSEYAEEKGEFDKEDLIILALEKELNEKGL